jgi:rhamnosyl/mannosyltransferase
METVLHQMCEGLLAHGHDVTALVAGTEGANRFEPILPSPNGNQGLLIRAGSWLVINSQPVAPSLPVLLRRELAARPPDIVQLHLPNPAACASALALLRPLGSRVSGPRFAVWYHADITRQRLGRYLVNPLVRRCLSLADGIAVSSAGLRRNSPQLASRQDKVCVIPFGIATSRWEAVQAAYDGPFLFVGRLVYYKGLSLLLNALDRVPAANLVIVGEGPLRKELQRKIQQNGLTGRVRLAGELPGAQLRQIMQHARALVLPSDQPSETFGVVQLEAMAAGLPVISSELPTGIAEVNLDRQTGRVVPPGDVESLAAAMAEILADSSLARRWGEAGRHRVRQHFTLEHMIDGIEQWYGALLDAGRLRQR